MYISQLNENTEGPRSTWCVSTTGTDECLCSVVAYRETVGRCRTSEKTTRHSACLASLCHVRRTRNTAIHCLPVAPDRQLPVQQRAAKYRQQHLILTPGSTVLARNSEGCNSTLYSFLREETVSDFLRRENSGLFT